jgi:23S rRNA (pseudouridine1915-N3)-methyltransferase
MRITLIAVGTRMPSWADEAFGTYSTRLPKGVDLVLAAVPAVRRQGRNNAAAIAKEAEAILNRLRNHSGVVIALDERGRQWSSSELSKRLSGWMQSGDDVALLVGGADGLNDQCRQRADHIWSLSRLTLPHAMARVVVAEQLYRATAILAGHPYHRA